MNLLQSLQSVKLVPVVVLQDINHAEPLAEALITGGINCMEITFRTDVAAEAIARIAKKFPDMILGAGTLLTPEQVKQAHTAGAHFGVAPGYDPSVVAAANVLNFPFIPGVSTASEMSQALAQGCIIQKFFPAAQAGGIPMLKALMGAFRHTGIRIMPTGGIDGITVKDWLTIPEVVACGGSWMCNANLIESKRWKEIAERSAHALETLKF